MSTRTVRTTLRIAAVLMCVVGFALVSMSVVARVALDARLESTGFLSPQASNLRNASIYTIIQYLMLSVWGTLLYAGSGSLARAVTGGEYAGESGTAAEC